MKEKFILVEELIDKGKEYAKTNLELYKLKAIDKGTDVFSSIASNVAMAVVSLFFIILFSVGLALYAGELLGKSYYGFFAVAGLYAVIGLMLLIFKKSILRYFNNYIINQVFKDKNDASNKR